MAETMKNNIITDRQIVSDILGLDISDVDMMLGADAFERLQKYTDTLEVQVGVLTEFIDELQDNEDLLNVETFDGQVNALRESLIAAGRNVEDNYALLETEEAVQERYVDMAEEPEALEAKRLMGGYSEATTDDDFSETVRDRLERL